LQCTHNPLQRIGLLAEWISASAAAGKPTPQQAAAAVGLGFGFFGLPRVVFGGGRAGFSSATTGSGSMVVEAAVVSGRLEIDGYREFLRKGIEKSAY
jgi:hypothetical protein